MVLSGKQARNDGEDMDGGKGTHILSWWKKVTI
jgi:hypothetical protein